MSNQRNADKDREIIAECDHMWLGRTAAHYLERAVSAEQRVAELEALAKHLKQQWDIEREEHNALKGSLESEDRP